MTPSALCFILVDDKLSYATERNFEVLNPIVCFFKCFKIEHSAVQSHLGNLALENFSVLYFLMNRLHLQV